MASGTIQVTIARAAIWEQVAMTTEYVGAKLNEDGSGRDQVMTTDGNQEQLERFVKEAEAVLCDQTKGMLEGVSHQMATLSQGGGVVSTTFNFVKSAAFDDSLESSLGDSVMCYFVDAVIAKWFGIANKPEAADYAAKAQAMLDDVKRKLWWKKRPTRPTYS